MKKRVWITVSIILLLAILGVILYYSISGKKTSEIYFSETSGKISYLNGTSANQAYVYITYLCLRSGLVDKSYIDFGKNVTFTNEFGEFHFDAFYPDKKIMLVEECTKILGSYSNESSSHFSDITIKNNETNVYLTLN